MKIVTLIENTAPKGLLSEWGLSIYIEYGGQKYLLDTGASGRFLENAKTLGVDIADVDAGILSHAHFDHADGMDAFFAVNKKAPFYLRVDAQENCYAQYAFFHKYIGIPRGILKRESLRILRAEGDYPIAPGVWLIPHKTSGLSAIGKAGHFAVRDGMRYRPDDFAHEQSLVFETAKGLVVLNSCSHGKADNILREVRRTFPDRPICAYIGGFHLAAARTETIEAYGDALASLDTGDFYTGHCTGAHAYGLLEQKLGARLHPLTTGTVIEFDEKAAAPAEA